MKTIRIWAALMLTSVLILSGCFSFSSKEEKDTLKLATFSQGSSWYVYGATMAEILREEMTDVNQIDVLPYAGGLGNVQVVAEGEADVGLTFSVNNQWAAEGSVAYDTPYENLTLLLDGLDHYYIGIIIRDEFKEKHGIESISDIKAKEIPVNLYTMNRGSQGEFLAREILTAHDLDYDLLRSYGGSVTNTSFDVVSSSFNDGRADMFIQMMTVGHPSFTEISMQTPVTFLSIEEEFREGLLASGIDEAVFPANVFKGQTKEIETVGFATTLIANENLSDDMAYEITKSLIENKQRLSQGHQALEEFNPKQTIERLDGQTIKIHPGAEKYYRERNWIKD
ncbi:TAXI family TRAP transporter solute-binding subunit [Bacillus sp. FJAT-44742]|uniref:TAXI family TRAP transporter solute-binding subunit n=1 Tax=Bacillus sp. FJAT-44742 TaxID=2014005 RepID=UPI000C235108|nr:TAXI family TRAP transporter solute-binding subunit [Bacillus sp. FJAT-44742]